MWHLRCSPRPSLESKVSPPPHAVEVGAAKGRGSFLPPPLLQTAPLQGEGRKVSLEASVCGRETEGQEGARSGGWALGSAQSPGSWH